jgi:hypothetical protein
MYIIKMPTNFHFRAHKHVDNYKLEMYFNISCYVNIDKYITIPNNIHEIETLKCNITNMKNAMTNCESTSFVIGSFDENIEIKYINDGFVVVENCKENDKYTNIFIKFINDDKQQFINELEILKDCFD